MVFIGIDHHKWKKEYLKTVDKPIILLSIEIASFSVVSPELSLSDSFILYHI